MKKRVDTRATILAAFAKLGPSSPRQILDHVGGTEKKVGYYLRILRAEGELHAVGTSNDRVYALKSQKLPGRTQPGLVATRHEPVAAMTADGRIVLTRLDGFALPTVIDAEFVAPIARLLKKAA